jgi:carboxylesterase type B
LHDILRKTPSSFDSSFENIILDEAKEQGKKIRGFGPAPVSLAWFGWNPPLFDNRLRVFHTLDISFWFYNTDVHISNTGGGSRPRNLSSKMAASLLRFMKKVIRTA